MSNKKSRKSPDLLSAELAHRLMRLEGIRAHGVSFLAKTLEEKPLVRFQPEKMTDLELAKLPLFGGINAEESESDVPTLPKPDIQQVRGLAQWLEDRADGKSKIPFGFARGSIDFTKRRGPK